MKPFPFTVILLFSGVLVSAQTYIPITDNLQIISNSNIKFLAGNYSFSDLPADGVIQLSDVQNVILDGDSCTVDGVSDAGYLIKITNSSDIVIRNFDSVFNYKYAVHIMNSERIMINGNVFSGNKVDSSGWISIWTDYQQALGGGVLMYQCREAELYDNNMTLQNDGVALYHCDSIQVHNNDFSWNTSLGIRMYWTDSCYIHQNNCSHVNRPYTDPSDCAALLMLVSNENRVEYNDLSYSGDGVFLGQYQHSSIPNNNYFAYNECSYSPHNAIEATFADGNIYKHNNCNYSHYGFWLGYSFNTIADSNQVIGNYQSGIAIDRGLNNSISGNLIRNNPIGIELWEGSPITGYTNQYSHDYRMDNNMFDGNTVAISAIKTEHALIAGNQFDYSQEASVYLEGQSDQDTLTGNIFRMPVMYHIDNNTIYDIYALNNTWLPGDTAMISEKIKDIHDHSGRGEVMWWPAEPSQPVAIQEVPSCDLSEPDGRWYAYPETGYPPAVKFGDSLYYDFGEKVVGEASVKFITSRGWYCALSYRPDGDSLASWSLTEEDTLYFWVRTLKYLPLGFQYFHIRIGDRKGNYYRYSSYPGYLNSAHEVWKQYKFPLTGATGFTRQTVGDMTLDEVNYVEFWADTWDYGFTLWLDGVQFTPCDPVTAISGNRDPKDLQILCYPNPFRDETVVQFTLEQPEPIVLSVISMQGKTIRVLHQGTEAMGTHILRLAGTDLPPGISLLRLSTPTRNQTQKLINLNK